MNKTVKIKNSSINKKINNKIIIKIKITLKLKSINKKLKD